MDRLVHRVNDFNGYVEKLFYLVLKTQEIYEENFPLQFSLDLRDPILIFDPNSVPKSP